MTDDTETGTGGNDDEQTEHETHGHESPEGHREISSAIGPDSTSGTVVETVHKRRNPVSIASVIIGILALIAGGVYATNNLIGGTSGGKTPEGTVRAIFDSVAHEDVLGVMENMLPGERDALRDPLTHLRDQLVRLGVLKSDFELSGIKGIDLNFANLKFSTTKLSDDVALPWIDQFAHRMEEVWAFIAAPILLQAVPQLITAAETDVLVVE